MPSPLENLCGPGKPLRVEPPDAAEFETLKRLGRERHADAGNASLALASRFDLACVLAKCHELRNKAEYEGLLDLDERLVSDLLAACSAVAAKIDGLAPLANS